MQTTLEKLGGNFYMSQDKKTSSYLLRMELLKLKQETHTINVLEEYRIMGSKKTETPSDKGNRRAKEKEITIKFPYRE